MKTALAGVLAFLLFFCGLLAAKSESLLWHGSANAVANSNAGGLFVRPPGNGGMYWATSKPMNELGVGAWKVGGNTNVQLFPPALINKGGLEATYSLTSSEAALFKPAWGPDFNWNPYQWWKGAAGQYYYRPNPATFMDRASELGKAAGITGAGVGIGVGGVYLWNSGNN